MATGDEVGERKEKRREEEDRSENILEGEREKGEEGGASNCGGWRLQKEKESESRKGKKGQERKKKGKGTPFSRERRERRYFFVLSPIPPHSPW